jgi:hypothetical protein
VEERLEFALPRELRDVPPQQAHIASRVAAN